MNELCKCGCGKEVSGPGVKYIKGHNKPMFGKKLSEESKLKMSKNHNHIGMTGKKHSEKSKLKMSISGGGRFGWKHSKETIIKMSKVQKGRPSHRKGKTLSFNHKLNLSLSAIKFIENHFNGEQICPRTGKNEIFIINKIENIIDLHGISNDRNLFLRCGKWPDRYYKKYNLCVEILEPWHYKENNQLGDNDLKRELVIASRLGCIIYYISEQEFIKNSENELQKFKNFVNILQEA